MVFRNPKDHNDQWLVAAAHFADNFAALDTPADDETIARLTRERDAAVAELGRMGGPVARQAGRQDPSPFVMVHHSLIAECEQMRADRDAARAEVERLMTETRRCANMFHFTSEAVESFRLASRRSGAKSMRESDIAAIETEATRLAGSTNATKRLIAGALVALVDTLRSLPLPEAGQASTVTLPALPTDADDEAIVDAMVAERTKGLARRAVRKLDGSIGRAEVEAERPGLVPGPFADANRRAREALHSFAQQVRDPGASGLASGAPPDPLAMGETWSVPAFVARLVGAANHLLSDHSCDAHGYEGVTAARDAAVVWLAKMGVEPDALTPESPFAATPRPVEGHGGDRAGMTRVASALIALACGHEVRVYPPVILRTTHRCPTCEPRRARQPRRARPTQARTTLDPTVCRCCGEHAPLVSYYEGWCIPCHGCDPDGEFTGVPFFDGDHGCPRAARETAAGVAP
jgi:hypothetical protein